MASLEKIPPRNNLQLGCCGCRSKDKRYKQLLRKSYRRLNKELDLQRFIERQRATSYAIFSLMSHSQARFIGNLSRLIIKEDMESSSDE